MGSLDSDVLIRELTQRIKRSFHERDFNKLLGAVKERESNLRKEIEKLTWDRDLAKNDVRLLNKNVELLELERSQIGEKLRKTLRKCKELEEAVARVKNRAKEERVLWDKLKGASRMSAKNLEQMKLNYDQVVGKLTLRNIEANEIIEGLRLKKMESDKEAEMYEIRLENSTRTIKKIEENLAKLSTVKVGDIATWVNDLCKDGTSEEGGNLESRGFIGTKGENSSGSRNNRSSKKGDKNSVQPRSRKNDDDDDAQKVKTSHSTQSGRNPPQEEPKEGTLGGGLQLLLCSSKYAHSSPAADGNTNIAEIIDSDEDTNPDRVTQIPSIGIFDAKAVTKETHLFPTPLSSQTNKQDRTGSGDALSVNFTAKRKRDVCTVHVDNTVSTQEKGYQILKPTRFGIGYSLEKSNCTSDEDSADSEDESLSDSRMVELVESLKSKNTGRNF